jgi:hypothetical protein
MAGTTLCFAEVTSLPGPLPPRVAAEPDGGRHLAGTAFLIFGAFEAVAPFAVGYDPTWAAVGFLQACIDLALAGVLYGTASWPRTAGLLRAGVGLAAGLAFPFLPGAGALADAALLRVVGRSFFFAGVLLLLPGSAGRERRWAGGLMAFVPYALLKLLAAVGPAFRAGDWSAPIADYLRAFLAV